MHEKNERVNDHWFYRDGDTPVGPFDLQGLDRLFTAGIISDITLVRHGESRHWAEYGALKEEVVGNIDDRASQPEESDWIGPRTQAEPVADSETNTSQHDDSFAGQNDTKQQLVNHWLLEPVTPWRRYGARVLDLSLNGVLGWFLIGTAFYAFAPVSADRFFNSMNPLTDLMLTVFIGVVITGVLIGFSGSSIGKWVFGIRITDANGRPIGIGAGIMRDLNVWVKGMGFGLPIVALITLYLGYRRLTEKGVTSWDESGGYLVSHRPNSAFQYILNTIGILLILFINAFVRSLEQI